MTGIGLDDTRELEGMASLPVSEHMFNVKEFDQLTGLVDTIFGGEACGKARKTNCFIPCYPTDLFYGPNLKFITAKYNKLDTDHYI